MDHRGKTQIEFINLRQFKACDLKIYVVLPKQQRDDVVP